MLIDIATASPPYKVLQEKAAAELKKRMSVRPAIGRLIESASVHSGIDSRYIVIPDAEEGNEKKFYSSNGTYIQPDTRIRMNEYEKWSKLLAKEAVSKLFEVNNFNPEKLERLITVTCTGFFAPGLDSYLIEEFKIPQSIKRINIGFMGCAAAITAINSVYDALNSAKEKELNSLLVAVELCSIHLQTQPTRDNILANLIFADGCAAALFSNSKSEINRFEIIHTETFLFNNSADYMGWKIGNFGFEMILSSELPKIILESASPQLLKIISSKGIDKTEIKYWALHPGGRAILDSLQNGIGLTDEQMLPSRKVLKNFGNMSSASILFVLKEILNSYELKKVEYCCAVAFGPGLTMETVIFRVV
ncbi:MAG: type III polyketide synthase [Ignavibacteriales bacterium]|nr:MAG: type III polyketide synthase [Ignavibacteriales bacterium]